jgi:hypothetical protein
MREPNASVRARPGVSGILVVFLFLALFPADGIWAAAPTQEASVVEPLPPRSPPPVSPSNVKKETKIRKETKKDKKAANDSERPASIPQLAQHLDETIKILERDINDTAEVARTSVKIRASQMLQEVQQAQRDLARSESEAQRLAKPSAIDLPASLSNSSAVISTLIPADPVIVAQALRRAAQKVSELKQEADNRFAPPVQQAIQAAPVVVEKSNSAALQEARKALVTPLQDARTLLKGYSSRPDAVSKAVLMKLRKQFSLVQSRVGSTLDRMAGQIISKALQTLDAAAGNSSQVRVAAQRAEKIMDAMRRLNEQRTQAALSQLDKLCSASSDISTAPVEHKTDPAQIPPEQIRRQVLAAVGRTAPRLNALQEEAQNLQK